MRGVRSGKLPLWLKIAFTLFMAVLVPVYWYEYGPTNFLYFCDASLFFTLAAVWLESPLLASAPLVGIFLPQMLWVVDFLAECVGLKMTGLTEYMFDPGTTLFARGLSFFHFWLPFLLLWLVWRLGYDRRAFWLWTTLALALVLICYFWMPAPMPKEERGNMPVNINYVYGLNDNVAQTWMPQNLYILTLMAALPILIFAPTHWLSVWLLTRKNPAPTASV